MHTHHGTGPSAVHLHLGAITSLSHSHPHHAPSVVGVDAHKVRCTQDCRIRPTSFNKLYTRKITRRTPQNRAGSRAHTWCLEVLHQEAGNTVISQGIPPRICGSFEAHHLPNCRDGLFTHSPSTLRSGYIAFGHESLFVQASD